MITLVTGGARSGKSTFAEEIFKDRKDVVYMATSRITDMEMQERIRLHQNQRPGVWRTHEANYNLHAAVGQETGYLLDCITVLVSNIMFDKTKDESYINYSLQNTIENTIMYELEKLIGEIKRNNHDLVLVTNEVGDSIVPEHHISRVFRDIQGRINQMVAKLADEVYLVCCGLPVKLK